MKRVTQILAGAAAIVLVCCTGCVTETDDYFPMRWQPHETATASNGGVDLSISYDSSAERFDGTVTNVTSATVTNVRVEIHLSNGTELGPTPLTDLTAGESKPVTLSSTGETFDWYTVHVELGSSSS